MTGELPEDLAIALKVVRCLNDLGVPAIVVGSVASSLYGEPRFTRDVDLLAPLQPHHVARLVAALQHEFYIDEGAVREAVASQTCFNAIHLATVFKVDVFVVASKSDEREMARAVKAARLGLPGAELAFASAEDVLVKKLVWFRIGGEQSETQWRDIVGVLRVRRVELDRGYMRQLATELGVPDLLQRALVDAGLEPADLFGDG